MYYNMIGQRFYLPQRPIEPPDAWGEEGDEEEDDTPDWVYDEDHSYVLRKGKVIRYE